MRKRILSGMRPTGKLHLGHLVGALKNWVKLQDEYECYFMVADWHALMSEYENASVFRENALDNVIDWISCGIDPKKSTIFIQSDIKEHLELAMIFSSITPLGWLVRCPTYKEQLREVKNKDLHTYAFLGYPVLQAADILVYKANAVPVGQDQLPHLEITREIARRFNHLYKPLLPEPEALLTKVPKLLGIDGRKMSKTYENAINLSDPEPIIKEKVRSMFTDPQRIKRTDTGRPEVCNVYSYFSVFAPEERREIGDGCRSAKIGCTECKERLGCTLVNLLEPIHKKRKELLANKRKLNKILQLGEKKARKIASRTINEIKKATFKNGL
ncbi:MAG: tryptophan--tRNA ligase [Candidatus Atribacteria bacterium]|nr:tryptophan--tRNA ligase [Candidatus Atribacteria bacterium]